MNDYRKSHLSAGKGRSYDASFSENPYRKMVWDFEKSFLMRVINEIDNYSELSHLDFACGTGRVLSYVRPHASVSVGVDISSDMLSVAREDQGASELIQADLTKDDVLGSRKFDLITAFRFFPNAEPELRLDAMKSLVRHMTPTGYLVFNNHKSTRSTRNLLARLAGRKNFQGMSEEETKELVEECGLEISGADCFCLLPISEKNPLLPLAVLAGLEGLLRKIKFLRKFGENQLVICRRLDRNAVTRV